MDVCQPFIKFSQNQDITKYLSVSQFLGVKLGVDFEFTPRRMKSLYSQILVFKRLFCIDSCILVLFFAQKTRLLASYTLNKH